MVLAVGMLAVSQFAHAFDPFVVSDIRVDGMQRTEPGSVFARLPFKVGQRFTEELATESVRKLYETGLYSDVRIQTTGRVVIVQVQERPTIASISFTGMREFEPKAMIDSFKQVGFGDGRVFDQAMLDQAQFELKQQYLAKVFQALRIAVNSELDVLKDLLKQSHEVLKPGGRLSVISYHSLEDRLVKNFIKSGNFEGKVEQDFYGNKLVDFKAVNRQLITPSEEELKLNNRSRSAKLRIAEKL